MEPILTNRETQVLRCLAQGNSRPFVGKTLGITRANVQNVVGRLRLKGFQCDTEAGRNHAKEFLAKLPQYPKRTRLPGFTDHQMAILMHFAKGKSYAEIATILGAEREKVIKPITIQQAVSQSVQVIGAGFVSESSRRAKVAQWLKENVQEYVASSDLDDELNPSNY